MSDFQISMASARVNANLTQDEIACKMGVSKRTVVNWEKGRVVPKMAQFEMYCRIWNIGRENVFLPIKST